MLGKANTSTANPAKIMAGNPTEKMFRLGAARVAMPNPMLISNKATITGKAFRPRPMKVGAIRWLLMAIAWGYILVAVILPMAALTLTSFEKFATVIVDQMKFTLANYETALAMGSLAPAFGNSLFLGIVVASIGVSQLVNPPGQQAQREVQREKIYVALADIDIGQKLGEDNVRLEAWYADNIPPGAVRRLEDLQDGHQQCEFVDYP